MEQDLTVFETPYCNIHQLLAWVYTGDRQIVAEVSDSAPRGSFREEVSLPDGTTDLVERHVDRRSPLHLYAATTFNGSGTARSWKSAQAEILSALQLGELEGFGVPNNVGELQAIPRAAWSDLSFYFEPDIAGPQDALRAGAVRWHNLKFESVQALKLWPDPLATIRIRNATDSPPVPISDEELATYLRFDIWTPLEAIFLLHGCIPRNEENADDELWAHFIDAHTHLTRALLGGTIGRQVDRAGDIVWVDSPSAWYRWALRKNWPLDARVVDHFSASADTDAKSLPTSPRVHPSRSRYKEPPSGRMLQRAQTLQRNEAWQRRANELWTKNPALSKADVARQLEGEAIADGKKQSTIRQAIKEPRRRPKRKT